MSYKIGRVWKGIVGEMVAVILDKFYLKLFLFIKRDLKMSSNPQTFPQNLPYIQGNTSRLSYSEDQQIREERRENTNPQLLIERIQVLQKQLSQLTTLLAEDGGFQQAYIQLQQQNEQLRASQSQKEEILLQMRNLQNMNELLKTELLNHNEEMERLHRDYVEARNSNSRMQERGHSQDLESKVEELNDQISNLLVKIQSLVEENQMLVSNLAEAENAIKEMQVQNEILKEQMRNLEELTVGEQRNMQERYIKELEDSKSEIQELRQALQKNNAKAGQIRSNNTDRLSEERSTLQQQMRALRSQLSSKNEQLLCQKDNEVALRRKWQRKMAQNENEIYILSEQVSKLKGKIRLQESKSSEYQYILQQQQKDKERIIFYKTNYSDTEQLRKKIVRLQTEKEELSLRVQKMNIQLSQRKFQALEISQTNNRRSQDNFLHDQIQSQLELCKRMNKQLKNTIQNYESDYKKIRKDYEQLLEQKLSAQKAISQNHYQLQSHKKIYEQLVIKYNHTSSLYKGLEEKIQALQTERFGKSIVSNYDKQNINLVRLQNSTLKQEINKLKDDISRSGREQNRSYLKSDDTHRQTIIQMKNRERQYAQQLELYRQKYLKQLEKSKNSCALEDQVEELEQKLVRVNRMLNQKLKEIDYLQKRQQELSRQIEHTYQKSKIQFDSFGVRHHPQVKKLQAEILAFQRQLMESQLAYKQQISACQDELRLCRLQNQHHRAKIDELLIEVNKQRNSLEYSKLTRSLELSELAQKELRRQLQLRDKMNEELRSQLRQTQRAKQQNHSSRQYQQLKHQNQRLSSSLQAQTLSINSLVRLLDSLDPSSRNQEPIKRAYIYLQKHPISKQQSNQNSITHHQKQRPLSRYDQLSKKKQSIMQQFHQSQQYLQRQPEQKQQRHGILQRLRQNLAT